MAVHRVWLCCSADGTLSSAHPAGVVSLPDPAIAFASSLSPGTAGVPGTAVDLSALGINISTSATPSYAYGGSDGTNKPLERVSTPSPTLAHTQTTRLLLHLATCKCRRRCAVMQ